MRTRITFLAGFAAGFLAGARAGRERYEQIVKLGRKAAEHPAVRQATRAAGAKATELSKTAGQKAAERMPKLAEREQRIIQLRFGLTDGHPRTLEEVGREFGVTRERIRQIESKTLAKLRHPSRAQMLREYLD